MGLLPAAKNYIALRVRFKNSIERKKRHNQDLLFNTRIHFYGKSSYKTCPITWSSHETKLCLQLSDSEAFCIKLH